MLTICPPDVVSISLAQRRFDVRKSPMPPYWDYITGRTKTWLECHAHGSMPSDESGKRVQSSLSVPITCYTAVRADITANVHVHITCNDIRQPPKRQSSNPTILFKPHPFDRHPAHPSNHRPSRDSRFPLCRREESSCGGKNVGRRLFGACGRSYTGGVRADVAEAGARRDQLSGL
jgi:hypothetical protein